MTDKIKISRRNFLLGSGAITAATLVTAPETLAKNLAPSPVADNLTHQQEEVLSKNYRYHFSGKLPDQIPEATIFYLSHQIRSVILIHIRSPYLDVSA